MPTYVSLIRYTHQGIAGVKDSPKRLDAFKDAVKKAGGTLKSFYLTMGRYDIVAAYELPDDETAAKVALAVGSLGNIRTETLRAFGEDEFRKIIAGLP